MGENDEKTIWAIKNGEFDTVYETFHKNEHKANEEIKGRFPLHYAADFGQFKVLKLLIEMGAQVDKKDKHGITPILAAIWEGHTTCVELLLENGAQKDGSTPDGQSYLEAAEKDEIKKLLQA